MAGNPQNFRLQKTRSMKAELRKFTNKVQGAVAQAAVDAYAQAGFEAFIMCLPAVTMLTRLNATIELDGFPGAFGDPKIINHGKGGSEPCLEYDEKGASEKGTMKNAWKFRLGKAVEEPDNSAVQAHVELQDKRLGKRLVQASHDGTGGTRKSRSTIKSHRLRFYTHRMASEEPLLAMILERTGSRNISLVGIHMERIKNNLDANFLNFLQQRLDAGEFRRILNEQMAKSDA